MAGLPGLGFDCVARQELLAVPSTVTSMQHGIGCSSSCHWTALLTQWVSSSSSGSDTE
jgi:hypothetical protein